MTFPEAEAFLLSLPRFADAGAAAYRPGLERMAQLAAGMGDPHRAFPILHVAGTNGKGSTASMAAALLTASGWKTGLHTSPHLWHLAERLRVDGAEAPESWIAAAVTRHVDLIRRVQPSFFEATVALSFLYFAEMGVEAAVVEVGLGGRLDATNIVASRVALVTSIALDHTDLLGETLADIAREKAGIFRAARPALTNADAPEAVASLRAEATRRGATLERVQDTVALRDDGGRLSMETPLATYPDLRLALEGAHQRWNAALAVRGVEHFTGGPLQPDAVRRALADLPRLAGLRARLQQIHDAPRVLADVCHNPAGLAVALEAARPASGGRLHVLFGLMRDKDAPAMARLLAASGAIVHPVPLEGPRALPAEELARLLAEAGAEVATPSEAGPALEAFLTRADAADVLLVAGSHGVVASLNPSLFAETRQKHRR